MRRASFLVLIFILAAAGFGGTYWFLKSPYYSLYQIGKAIHDHDAPLFLAYVDLERIVGEQQNEFVELFLPKDQASDASQVVSTLLAAIAPQVTKLIKVRIVEEIRNPGRNNLPNSYILMIAAQVERNGSNAEVLLEDPSKPDTRLRFSMQPHAEQGHWQVVRVNPRDLKALLAEELKKKLVN